MLVLNTEKREIFGKKLFNEREAGKLPIAVYGPKEETKHYFVKQNEFLKIWKQAGESSIVKLDVGGKNKDILIQEVQLHGITGKPLHADFYVIQEGMKVKVSVPLKFEGEAPAIKAFGGVLVKVMQELEVEAAAADLPHEVIVNISSLNTLEDRVLVKDLKIGAGVKVTAVPEQIVALVSKIEEKEEEEEAGPIDLTKIEVEKKGKKEEEGAPAEEGAKKEPAKKEVKK